jgi:hypothetical protein
MIRFFADSTTSVTRIMFDCTLCFPSGGGELHPILIQEHKESRCMLGSFGMTISHKSFKSINDVLACYSYHNPNTLVCSEVGRLW